MPTKVTQAFLTEILRALLFGPLGECLDPNVPVIGEDGEPLIVAAGNSDRWIRDFFLFQMIR